MLNINQNIRTFEFTKNGRFKIKFAPADQESTLKKRFTIPVTKLFKEFNLRSPNQSIDKTHILLCAIIPIEKNKIKSHYELRLVHREGIKKEDATLYNKGVKINAETVHDFGATFEISEIELKQFLQDYVDFVNVSILKKPIAKNDFWENF